MKSNSIRIAMAAVLLLPLGGCADYPAVSSLSSTMARTVGTWQPISDDYLANCRRAGSLGAFAATAGDPCAAFGITQKQLDDAFLLLGNYFDALGAVASDSSYALDPGLDALGDSAKGIGANADQVDAIAKLGAALASLATTGIRRRSMDGLIGQTDHVIAVVEAIRHVVDVDYKRNVVAEAALWTSRMRDPASAFDPHPTRCEGERISWDVPPDRIPSPQEVVFRDFYVEKCNAILARATAIAAFDASAGSLVDSLAFLRSNKAKLRDDQIASQLFTQGKALFDDAQAVQKAFAAAGK